MGAVEYGMDWMDGRERAECVIYVDSVSSLGLARERRGGRMLAEEVVSCGTLLDGLGYDVMGR